MRKIPFFLSRFFIEFVWFILSASLVSTIVEAHLGPSPTLARLRCNELFTSFQISGPFQLKIVGKNKVDKGRLDIYASLGVDRSASLELILHAVIGLESEAAGHPALDPESYLRKTIAAAARRILLGEPDVESVLDSWNFSDRRDYDQWLENGGRTITWRQFGRLPPRDSSKGSNPGSPIIPVIDTPQKIWRASSGDANPRPQPLPATGKSGRTGSRTYLEPSPLEVVVAKTPPVLPPTKVKAKRRKVTATPQDLKTGPDGSKSKNPGQINQEGWWARMSHTKPLEPPKKQDSIPVIGSALGVEIRQMPPLAGGSADRISIIHEGTEMILTLGLYQKIVGELTNDQKDQAQNDLAAAIKLAVDTKKFANYDVIEIGETHVIVNDGVDTFMMERAALQTNLDLANRNGGYFDLAANPTAIHYETVGIASIYYTGNDQVDINPGAEGPITVSVEFYRKLRRESKKAQTPMLALSMLKQALALKRAAEKTQIVITKIGIDQVEFWNSFDRTSHILRMSISEMQELLTQESFRAQQRADKAEQIEVAREVGKLKSEIENAVTRRLYATALETLQAFYDKYAVKAGDYDYVRLQIAALQAKVRYNDETNYLAAYRALKSHSFKEFVREQANLRWQNDPAWQYLFR